MAKPSSISIDEVCSLIRYLEERSNQFDLLTEEYLELQARFSKQEEDYNAVVRELEDARDQKEHQEDVVNGLESECNDLKEQNEQMEKEAFDREQQYEKNLQVMAATIVTLNDQNARMNMEQMQLSAYMNVILDDMETREQEIHNLCKETDIERELGDACCAQMSKALVVKKDLIAQNLAYKSKITLLGGLLRETTTKCMDLSSKLCSLQERLKNSNAATIARNTEPDSVMDEIECVEMQWSSQYRETMEMLQSVHVDYLSPEPDEDDDEDMNNLGEERGDASSAPIKSPEQDHDDNARSIATCTSVEDDATKGARAKASPHKKGRGGAKGKKKKQKGNKNNNWRSASPTESIDPFADEERVPELPPECYVPPARATDNQVGSNSSYSCMSIEEIKRIRAICIKKGFLKTD